MARARNIKPSTWKNDELAENEPLGRLLFIALWSIADFRGNLEWRPKKVKTETLPYDDDCDIEKLAINLDKTGFIRFYSRAGRTYINICTFEEHQNPHKNERDKGSDIPEYSEELRQLVDLKGLTINRDLSGLNQEYSTSDRAVSCFPLPDSCSLIPDTNNPKSDNKKPTSQKLDYSSWPEMPSDKLLKEWKKSRSKLKVPTTQRVINDRAKELHAAYKHGFSVEKCLETIIDKGWKGFEANWMLNLNSSGRANQLNTIEDFKQDAINTAQRIKDTGILNDLFDEDGNPL